MSSRSAEIRTGVTALALTLLAPTAVAWQPPDPFGDLRLNGYASQGFVLTDGNDFFGDSSGGSFDYRELGLTASWQPHRRVLFAAQGTAREAGATSDGDPHLDIALLDLRIVERPARRGGLRLGRVRLPYAFYNETRDVLQTRPNVLLSHAVYAEVSVPRDLLFSGDGIRPYFEADIGLHTLSFDYLHADDVHADDETRDNTLGARNPGVDIFFDTPRIFRLLYAWDGGRARAGLTWVNFTNVCRPRPGGACDPSLAEAFGPFADQIAVSTHARAYVVSLEYVAELWSVSAEYSNLRSRQRIAAREDLGFPGSRSSSTGDGIYLQFTRALRADLGLLLRYDLDFGDIDDRKGHDFERRTGRPRYLEFGRDLTVGLRWDITPAWTAMLEHHLIDGLAGLSRLDNPGRGDDELDRYWNLTAAAIGFRF